MPESLSLEDTGDIPENKKATPWMDVAFLSENTRAPL
jgi:hypothetical protein